ncbi:hypothetical protein HNP25_003877 [Arcicella rosea]|uniref:Uncharacterized protein n=1 Tax=Arcicella rosea TaxID=502909 RepID=A0A841EPP0_9BACT|nr:hypothetical protein [Arcicella rosea]
MFIAAKDLANLATCCSGGYFYEDLILAKGFYYLYSFKIYSCKNCK